MGAGDFENNPRLLGLTDADYNVLFRGLQTTFARAEVASVAAEQTITVPDKAVGGQIEFDTDVYISHTSGGTAADATRRKLAAGKPHNVEVGKQQAIYWLPQSGTPDVEVEQTWEVATPPAAADAKTSTQLDED